jgi:hypothetical protein
MKDLVVDYRTKIANPTGNSLYQRKPGRLAGERKKFRALVENA